MKIVSWNVNGLRAVQKKGFCDWLAGTQADIVGLQETRVNLDDVPPELRELHRYQSHFVAAERAGYSGVGLYARTAPEAVETRLRHNEIDSEGRVQIARWGKLTLANVYFPNGSGKERDNGRVPFKLDFYQKLFRRLETERKKGQRILVMGDFNTAHQPIDLARPKQNEKTSGYLQEEREELTRWLAAGYVDTFRAKYPAEAKYSWWSQRFGVREKNIGWRIDMVYADAEAHRYIQDAFIDTHVMGSDHCPVGVLVDPKITK